MAVWNTARRDPKEHINHGWLGRSLDAAETRSASPAMVFVGGGQLPLALRSRRSVASALSRPEDFVLAPEAKGKLGPAPEGDDLTAFVHRMAVDAQATAERMKDVVGSGADEPTYPSTELAQHLQLTARLIKADVGTRVFYTRQPGYDTHSAQFGLHSQLLGALSAGLKAFLDDLTTARLAERVLVLMFSEFGRTVKENGSAGTDHGTAAPVFLAGAALKGGLVGETPSLTDLDPKHGDLKIGLDFRRVYATLLEEWLKLPARNGLGGAFERLDLLRP
jgi:uncharacterized protein (DUF1501 family)